MIRGLQNAKESSGIEENLGSQEVALDKLLAVDEGSTLGYYKQV